MDWTPDSIGRRVIFHIDCNGFYASVEETIDPALKQVPMAICGDPKSRKGIILAKNELAKQAGIKTAETIWQARQKCPELILRPARHSLYSEYCEKLNRIYEQYTDQVERYGRDESYLDVTGSMKLFGGDPVALAHVIRERIPKELGLTVSVGVSFNKVFAKLGSDLKKPNAVTVISRYNYQDTVWPLPASSLFMVGDSCAQTLHKLLIETIGDIAKSNPDHLERKLGKLGRLLHRYANGQDDDRVRSVSEPEELKSVGNSRTFTRNLTSAEDIRAGVDSLADQVAFRLRSHGVKCMSLQVTIKDPAFKIITRQKGLPHPTWLSSELSAHSLSLISDNWDQEKPIRLLAVTAQKLVPAEQAVEQTSLFETPQTEQKRKNRENLEIAMDRLRKKHGGGIITNGSLFSSDLALLKHSGEVDSDMENPS